MERPFKLGDQVSPRNSDDVCIYTVHKVFDSQYVSLGRHRDTGEDVRVHVDSLYLVDTKKPA